MSAPVSRSVVRRRRSFTLQLLVLTVFVLPPLVAALVARSVAPPTPMRLSTAASPRASAAPGAALPTIPPTTTVPTTTGVAVTPPGSVDTADGPDDEGSIVDPVGDDRFVVGSPSERSVGDACAVTVDSLPVAPPPGWTVTCRGWRPNVAGETDPSTSTIAVFVAAGDDDAWLRRVLTHEIGHAHDFSFLGEADRERWQQERGFSGPWYTACTCSDLGSGSGDFAESFMYTFLPSARPFFASRLAPPPTPVQQELLRSMLGRTS